MEFILFALLVSAFGVIPLLAHGKVGAAGYVFAVASVLFSVIFYFAVPSSVWPWWGIYGTCAWILWIASAIVDSVLEDNLQWTAIFPTALTIIYIVSGSARGWAIVNADEYAAMIGNVEERSWTQDVQPKDPRHIRMSSSENAATLARQTLGQAGSIGSQFQVDESRMTLQKIKNEFWWVAPLDFNGWATWRATRKVPAYVRVSAENPTLPGELVNLSDDQQLRYTPEACWGTNLARHLWYSGYRDKGLIDDSLEIDDNGKPWWVVTVFHPTLFESGEKIDGVVVVDPATGDNKFYALDQVPDWIDRVVPRSFAKNYIKWRGMLHLGWTNAYWLWGAGKDLTVPEEPNLVYGSDGYLMWATGATSPNENDTSLVGIYYTHSRTGRTVFYKAKGSTESAVLSAVDKDDQVQFKHLHGADTQLYNVYGTMAAIVPLLNENHLFQGVAIVNIENIQIMGIGSDQFTALRDYQKVMPLSGHQIAPELAHDIKVVEGVVDRRADVVLGGDQAIYLHISGVPHIFMASPKLSAELPMTKEGDRVSVKFYASGEQVEPMEAFDNLSLKLEATTAEQFVEQTSRDQRDQLQSQKDIQDARKSLNSLTDKELAELLKRLKEKK